MDIINDIRAKARFNRVQDAQSLTWLGPVRMLVIAFIAFGYASTLPRGPQEAEYLHFLGFDPSWYGISILFMISGFLALRSLERHESPQKFLLSRMGRNLPTLAVFAFMVVLIAFPLLGVPLDGTLGNGSQFQQHITYLVKVITCLSPDMLTPGLLDNALYMCVIQGGLWTFRWGAIAFILTATLWAFGGLRRRSTLFILTLFFIICYASLIVYTVQTPDAPSLLNPLSIGLRLGWAYLIGMCAYAFKDKLPRTLLVPAIVIILAALQYYLLRWTPFIEISTEIGFGYLVYLIMTSKTALPKSLKSLPDLSLGLYVFNWPAGQIMLLLIPSLTPLPLFALSFPVTIFLSISTWFLVSRKLNLALANRVAIPA